MLMEWKPTVAMKISVVCALQNMKKEMNGSNVLASDGFMKIIDVVEDSNGLPRVCPYCLS